MERLDKIVSVAADISRSDAKVFIKKGYVTVNGSVETDPQKKFETTVELTLKGTPLSFNRFVYIMMNKPEGVVSATEDPRDVTAIDLVKDKGKRNLFPAGRLDKNTTGFLLLTDDGDFAHRILSPSKHVEKEYEAETDKTIPKEAVEGFLRGVRIGDYECKPATLRITGDNKATVIIREGKYHQIKRMFEKYGVRVVRLKRVRMGNLRLDENLAPGEYKKLSSEEIVKIAQSVSD